VVRKRYIALGLFVVAVAVLAIWLPQRVERTNASVIAEIQTNPGGERAVRSMVITLADGRVYPVNYLREGNLVFMGIDGRWWRAFQGAGQQVEMLIQGQRLTGLAKVELDDQAYIDEIFARLRPKVPSWLPNWLNGKLVAITLDNGVSDTIKASDS
jgi:hypothetical protein